MKTLMIIRHAKSSWNEPGLPDHDRPLNDRGLQDASLMGAVLRDWDLPPTRVISSSAVRALTTAELVLQEIGWGVDEIQVEEDLYHASAGGTLDIILSQEDRLESLMLFGHNPGMTDLVNRLSDADLTKLPTAGLFIAQYDVPRWQDLGPSRLGEYNLEFPKSYR